MDVAVKLNQAIRLTVISNESLKLGMCSSVGEGP
jgi:hypothetical protein